MVCSCKSLKYLELSKFNTENVIDMENMFRDCYSLININLSDFNTQNVINIKSMFVIVNL